MASAAAARPLASVGRNQIMDSKYVERPVEGLRTAVRFRPAPPTNTKAPLRGFCVCWLRQAGNEPPPVRLREVQWTSLGRATNGSAVLSAAKDAVIALSDNSTFRPTALTCDHPKPHGRRARGFAKHCFAPLRATSATREARARHIPPGSNTKSRFAATRQPSAPVPPPYSCCARCSSWRRQSSVWNQPARWQSAHKVRGPTADPSRRKPAPTAGR